MFGMNIKQEGISIEGDQTEFARWTHIWRRVRKCDAFRGERIFELYADGSWLEL